MTQMVDGRMPSRKHRIFFGVLKYEFVKSITKSTNNDKIRIGNAKMISYCSKMK